MQRMRPRRESMMVPQPAGDGRGFFVVDATWGEIAPIQLAPGVRTVGELEVMEHARAGLPLVDTRKPEFYEQGTIPGAVSLPHEELDERAGELDPATPAVFFCNGPQCTATPQMIEALLERGHPPEAIRYYRGGMHDWITLGLPVGR